MTKTEKVPSEKKENPLLRTLLRIGAIGLGIYALFVLQPTLSLVSENTVGEVFRGIRGAIHVNGVEHGLTLGVRVGNRSVGLVARR